MANKTIRIKILTSDSLDVGSFKELYRNSVVIDSSVQFDYDLIERALSMLYPSAIIQFQISSL